MNAVIDRVVQYPNRFKLTNISDGTILGTFDLSPETGTVSIVGTILNHDLFQSIADDLASRVKTEGGVVSNTIETFTMAGIRTNITSGETISVSFGKIAKIINDLKAVAFSGDKADIGLGNVVNTADTAIPAKDSTDKFTSGGAYAELAKKVDKVAGSSLMTDAEHTKLGTIASGAEVNVNADWNATSGDAVILNKPTIPTVPVQSVNSKTGSVVLTGSDIATSSADSEKLDSKSVANMLHLGAYDTYTYDGTTKKYTVTRKTTYNNDGTQSESSHGNIETLSDRYFARTGQPYIEEWKKSEADRSSNLCNTFDRSNIPSDSSLYSATLNPDGSYTSTATSDSRIWSYSNSDFKFDLEPGTYTLSAIIKSSSANAGINLFDSNNNLLALAYGESIDSHSVFTLTSRTSVGIMVKPYTGSTYIMLSEGSAPLPYQPYEGEVVHGKGLDDSLASKQDTLTFDSVPTENSTNPITSGGVYTAVAKANQSATEGLAKKLDKGDWREYQFDYAKNTDALVSISPALENGTYICEILARGTGDYSAITTCYSLGVFSGYGTIKAYVGGMTFAYGAIHNLSAHIDNPLMDVRGDLDYLQEGPYKSYLRFRKIADD
jgi:hypothetical protein